MRRWCKSLKIKKSTCSDAERSSFKYKNPGLGGAFGLIQQQELQRLIDSRTNKRARLQETASSSGTSTAKSSTTNTGNLGSKYVAVVDYSESCDEDSPPVSDHPEVPLSTTIVALDDWYENTSEVESPARAKTVERRK